ncbi:MAG: hypothetical protein IJ364_02605 [Oscillospiraceae bacterium]|nr:hypothetical protein [Oscillospiraceae bacterium]
MGNKKISVCAYTDGKTEVYEIREESKMLWHREYPIGQGIADFFHAEAFNNNIYSMLDKSPVFATLAAGEELEDIKATQLWLKDILPMDAIPENLSYSRVCYEQVRFGFIGPFHYDSIGRKLEIEQHPSEEQLTEPFYTEVLYTDSAKDLISFMLVNCIKHGIRFRKCKYCGKYFGIVGNYNTEYCSRKVFQAGGKTCKDLGSFRIYEQKLLENPVIREYKRSYKAHNARVSKGLMTRDEFNAWSLEARERRDMCLRGELDFDEFIAWLESDRIRARK